MSRAKAERWAREHYGMSAITETGAFVRMWVEYRLPDGGGSAIQGWDIPLGEWRADFVDELVRVQFTNLAKALEGTHPEACKAIEREAGRLRSKKAWPPV